MLFLLCLSSQVHLVCVSVWISSLWTDSGPVSRGLQQFLAAARCLCDTFSGVLMLLSRLTAKQAAEASPLPGDGNGWLDGDSRGGGGGDRRRG